MKFTRTTQYWLCQILGWSTWLVITTLLFYLIAGEKDFKENYRYVSASIFLSAILLILATHLLRATIKKINWYKQSIFMIVIIFISSISFFTLLAGFLRPKIEKQITQICYSLSNKKNSAGVDIPLDSFVVFQSKSHLNKSINRVEGFLKENGIQYLANEKKYIPELSVEQQKKLDNIIKDERIVRDENGKWKEKRNWLIGSLDYIFWMTLWLAVYMAIFYIRRNRDQELATVKLENTVKQLELNNIKAHINPHFIFNALNSIRALVDVDPNGARNAITGLSNILRSSLLAEKSETIEFEKELNTVKDYLALEKIRFEERLKIEFDIQPVTLGLKVPPMILQMAVENAIKHGISNLKEGGLVHITSFVDADYHWIVVNNSGTLNENVNNRKFLSGTGFGVNSTKERLNMLYNGAAFFEIKNAKKDIVSCTIKIPLKVKQ